MIYDHLNPPATIHISLIKGKLVARVCKVPDEIEVKNFYVVHSRCLNCLTTQEMRLTREWNTNSFGVVDACKLFYVNDSGLVFSRHTFVFSDYNALFVFKEMLQPWQRDRLRSIVIDASWIRIERTWTKLSSTRVPSGPTFAGLRRLKVFAEVREQKIWEMDQEYASYKASVERKLGVLLKEFEGGGGIGCDVKTILLG